MVVVAGFGHHHDPRSLPRPHDTEGDHVAGAHALDHADGALDVLGEDVATANDDHVLDPPAHDELAVDGVGEVAGAQPGTPAREVALRGVEGVSGGVGAPVVAGRDRRARTCSSPASRSCMTLPAGSTMRISRPGTGLPSLARWRLLTGRVRRRGGRAAERVQPAA